MNNQLITNIRQQTKRLLDQLEQLEDNREDLTEEEYEELKESTHADLQTFQQYLINLQKGDAILDSQIEKSKKSILEAVKKSIDKKAIVSQLMEKQSLGLRELIKSLDNADHLKKISKEEYFSKKRKILVELQDTGSELTKQEKQWLQINHFDESNKQMSEAAQNKHMSKAEQNIKKLE